MMLQQVYLRTNLSTSTSTVQILFCFVNDDNSVFQIELLLLFLNVDISLRAVQNKCVEGGGRGIRFLKKIRQFFTNTHWWLAIQKGCTSTCFLYV